MGSGATWTRVGSATTDVREPFHPPTTHPLTLVTLAIINCRAGGLRRAGWHRVRKLLCFYYPHDVTTAPSAIVPGAQYLSTLTDEQRENDGMFLSVPAGSFVLLHYSMWHRGSLETKGERRVMLKLLFDRTEQPTSVPSWDHRQTPTWSEDTLRERPWVPALFSWLAGAPPPK